MDIIGSIWFNKIGIVLGVDEITKEKKAYIGTGDGINQHIDKQFIAQFGMPFPIKAAEEVVEYDRLYRE